MRFRRKLLRKAFKGDIAFAQRKYARIKYSDHIKVIFITAIRKELRRVPVFWRWRRSKEIS